MRSQKIYLLEKILVLWIESKWEKPGLGRGDKGLKFKKHRPGNPCS